MGMKLNSHLSQKQSKTWLRSGFSIILPFFNMGAGCMSEGEGDSRISKIFTEFGKLKGVM